jgi:hypothetical protein
MQGFVISIGVLIFFRIAFDLETSTTMMRNLQALAPHADTTSLESALNRVTPVGKSLDGLSRPEWVASAIWHDSSRSPHLFKWSGTAWGSVIGLSTCAAWVLLLPLRLRWRRSERASKIWGAAVAIAILSSTLFVVIGFSLINPTGAELALFPYWYEVCLLVVVCIAALAAASHPLGP